MMKTLTLALCLITFAGCASEAPENDGDSTDYQPGQPGGNVTGSQASRWKTYSGTETLSPHHLETPNGGTNLRGNGFSFANPEVTFVRYGNVTMSWDADNLLNEELELTVRASFTDLQIDMTGPSPQHIRFENWEIPEHLYVIVTMPDPTGGYLDEDAVRFDVELVYEGIENPPTFGCGCGG